MERVATAQSLGDRDAQEDAIRVARQSGDGSDDGNDLLLLLSDGMGGYAGGEVASNVTLDAFLDHFENGSENMRPRGRLEESLTAANTALAEEVARQPDLKGMGCTLVAVLSAAGRLVWVSVGDSVLFLMRDGELKKLNADHSYFGELLELVERGEMTLEEARAHPKKNALLSVITGGPIKKIDTNVIESKPGDLVVVASDGIETLSQDEIAAVARGQAAQGATSVSNALIEAVAAKGKPRQDNTSIIVMQIPDGGAPNFAANSQWVVEPDKRSGLSVAALSAAGGALLAGGVVAWVLWPEPAPVPQTPPVLAAPSGGEVRSAGPSEILTDEPAPPADDAPTGEISDPIPHPPSPPLEDNVEPAEPPQDRGAIEDGQPETNLIAPAPNTDTDDGEGN